MAWRFIFVKSIDCIIHIHSMNLKSFDLNLLRVLDALLEEGSTLRAGQRIGLSPPGTTAAIPAATPMASSATTSRMPL